MISAVSGSVSTITAHLKLNQDSRKALAEIASKVDQVRGDLPPAAQVPVIWATRYHLRKRKGLPTESPRRSSFGTAIGNAFFDVGSALELRGLYP